jgi:hypothetical protein
MKMIHIPGDENNKSGFLMFSRGEAREEKICLYIEDACHAFHFAFEKFFQMINCFNRGLVMWQAERE